MSAGGRRAEQASPAPASPVAAGSSAQCTVFRGLHERPYPFHEDCEGCEGEVVPDPPLLDAAPNWPSDWQPPRRWGECTIRAPDGGVALHAEPGAEPVDHAEGGSELSVLSEEGDWLQVAGETSKLWAARAAFSPEALTAARLRPVLEGLSVLSDSPGAPLAATALVKRQHEQQQQGGDYAARTPSMLEWLFTLPGQWATAQLGDMLDIFQTWKFDRERYFELGGCRFHPGDIVCSSRGTWQHLPRTAGTRVCCATRGTQEVLERMLSVVDPMFEPVNWTKYKFWVAEGRKGSRPEPTAVPAAALAKLSAHDAIEGVLAGSVYCTSLQCPIDFGTLRMLDLPGEGPPGWTLSELVVKEIAEGSRACRAGVQRRDMVIAVGSTAVISDTEVAERVKLATTVAVVRPAQAQRPLQYSIIGPLMRQAIDAVGDGAELVRRALSVFKPFVWRLSRFISLMEKWPSRLFRGVPMVRFAGRYHNGMTFFSHGFSSYSRDANVSAYYAGKSFGTFLTLHTLRAVDLAFCSLFPAQREQLLGPNAQVEVCGNFIDGESCLETPVDTITLRQRPEVDDVVLSAEEALWQLIDGRRAQLSLYPFRILIDNYVQPRVRRRADGAELRLVQALEEFVSSDAQWLVLVGSPGDGKSTALLWLYAKYLTDMGPDQGRVPFFVNMSLMSHNAEKDGWVQRRICGQLALDATGWRLLCERQMMVFADSADQIVAPREALLEHSLAARSGLPPGSKCCISVRDVDMQCMGLDPAHYGGADCVVLRLLRFEDSERRQLCVRFGAHAAMEVEQRLQQVKRKERTISEQAWTKALQGLPGCQPASDEPRTHFLRGDLCVDLDIGRRLYAEQAAALTEQRLARLCRGVADSTVLYAMAAEVAHQLPEDADTATVLEQAFQRQLQRRVACVSADTWTASGCGSDAEKVAVLMRVAEAVAAALTLAKQWSGQIRAAAALLPLFPGLPLRTVSAEDPTVLFALKHPIVQEWLATQWAARAPARGHGEEARNVLEVLRPGWASTYGEAEANRQRLRWISIAYVAAISIFVTINRPQLAPSSERYLRGLRLRRGLQELCSGAALILRPAEHALSSSPGGARERLPSPGQAGQDIEELGGAEGSGESLGRMQAGAQEAQKVAAGLSLAEFSGRAKTAADADYPPAPEIGDGAVVRAVAADATSDVLSHSPVPLLPIGELAEVIASPAGEVVQAITISPEGVLNSVSLPVAHLRCIASRLQVLQWARHFPEKWESEMEDPSFRAVDINCDAVSCEPHLRHKNRRPNDKQPAICCLRRSLEHITGKMLGKLDAGEAEWIDHLHRFLDACGRDGIEALQEGIAAAHIFSLEMLDPRSKKPRKVQIYTVLNDAMRNSWNEQLKPDTDSASRLALFAPLIVHLSNFTSRMAQEVKHRIVYRGINAIVAQGYKPGADFAWGCFSSTSEVFKTGKSFSSGVGTLFVLRERKAAPIAFCSMFPSEAERVLPPAKLRVLTRMPETTLCVAETRSDIVIAEELTDADSQMGLAEEAEASVQLRTKAHRCAGFIFETFAGRFVEPRLRIGETQVSLFAHFDGAGKQDRVTLLRGDGGTGKTSVMLALLEHMIRLSDESQVTPIFVHCPWAARLLTELEPAQCKLSDQDPETLVGPIVHALCAALALRTAAELRVLKQQHLVVLLDSLDECAISMDHGPGELLAKVPLLSRGGVDLKDWPSTRFVICCRKEFLDIDERMLDFGGATICEIQPFTAEEQREYVEKLATQEVEQLIKRLPGTTDVATAVSEMRCAMSDAGAADELKEALAKQKLAADKVASASKEDKNDAVAVKKGADDFREAARSAAVQQCVGGITAVLQCLPTDLLEIPFVLYLACSASRELSNANLRVAPRFKVYTAWVRRDIADRIARAPELAKFMPPTLDRADRLADKVSVLAVRMFALGGGWHSDVGSCVEMLGGGDMARAVLGVLPLRVESVQRDVCRVTWRHRTVQEFAIARAMIYPERTSAADWEAALTGPLDTTPETKQFFTEGVATLSDAEKAILTRSLRMATREVKAASEIASLADAAMQQQQPDGVSGAAQPESGTHPSRTKVRSVATVQDAAAGGSASGPPS